jgi:hypothetical protein
MKTHSFIEKYLPFLAVSGLGSLALIGCGAGDATHSGAGASGDESVGEATLAITVVPPAVQCIQVTVTGSTTVSQTFPVTPGSGTASSLSLGRLPLGGDTVTGQAYSVACASIASQTPTWIAASQTVQIQPGVVTSLTMTFRQNNPVTATPTFVGNITQVLGDWAGLSFAVVLSDGTMQASGYDPGQVYSQSLFGPVANLANVAKATGGYGGNNDCLVLTNGNVQCSGYGGFGALGNGTTNSSYGAYVTVPGVSGVSQIASGWNFFCAIDANQNVSCWGYNAYGQIGSGATTNVLSPQIAIYGANNVAVGSNHACATALGGEVYCWGYNGNGQLGINSTTNALSATWISSLTAVTQLAAGASHTCGLRADGSVFCWGYNAYGQIGNGTQTNALTPVQVAGISGAVQVIASQDSTCVRFGNGGVSCWGMDQNGEIADGKGSNSVTTPQPVVGIPPSAVLYPMYSGTCSVGTDQSVYCWGQTGTDSHGNVSFTPFFVPTRMTL